MSEQLFWVGAYTATMEGLGTGIGLARIGDDGAFESLGTAVETSSPSFLAAGVDGTVYSTDEGNGRIEAFRPGAGHTLVPLGGQEVSGSSPCHLSVAGDRLYASNYGDGSIDVFPLASDGSVEPRVQTLRGTGSGPHPAQDGPHAHATLVTGDTVLSTDLGADRVHRYTRVDGRLVRAGSAEFPAGTGPRDLLRTANGRILLLGELSGEIFVLDEEAGIVVSSPSVVDWVDGDHAAALAVDDRGGFVYTGLRGSNRLVVVGGDDLSPVDALPTGGDWPRHLCLVGDLLYVANQLSSTVTSFRLDRLTGIPHQIGSPEPVPSPTYLLPFVG